LLHWRRGFGGRLRLRRLRRSRFCRSGRLGGWHWADGREGQRRCGNLYIFSVEGPGRLHRGDADGDHGHLTCPGGYVSIANYLHMASGKNGLYQYPACTGRADVLPAPLADWPVTS